MNNLNLAIHEKQTNNTGSAFCDYVLNRVRKQNKNFIMMVNGETGSGKSWFSLSLACMLDEQFSKDQIVFSAEQFLSLIVEKKLPKGRVILYDEAGVGSSSYDWNKTENKQFDAVLQTFRKDNYIVLFTSPFESMVMKRARQLTHCVALMSGISYARGVSTARIFMEKHDHFGEMKTLHQHFRVFTNNGVKRITKLSVCKPHPLVVREYERMKESFTSDVNVKALGEIRRKLGKGEKKVVGDSDGLYEVGVKLQSSDEGKVAV